MTPSVNTVDEHHVIILYVESVLALAHKTVNLPKQMSGQYFISYSSLIRFTSEMPKFSAIMGTVNSL